MASHLLYTILVFCANFHSPGNVIQFIGDNFPGTHTTITPHHHHTSDHYTITPQLHHTTPHHHTITPFQPPSISLSQSEVKTWQSHVVWTARWEWRLVESGSVMTVLHQLMWLMGPAHKSGLEFLPSIQASFTEIFKFSSQLDSIWDGEIILLVRARVLIMIWYGACGMSRLPDCLVMCDEKWFCLIETIYLCMIMKVFQLFICF